MRSLVGEIAGALGRLVNQAPPVRYSGGPGGRLLRRSAGRSTQLGAYSGVGTVFAIVDLLASATASCDWDLFRHADGRGRIAGPDQRKEVTSHLALDLLANPNPFYTQRLLFETLQQHMELVGEMWIVVERNPAMRSIPLGLWPVRPDRMEPVPSETAGLAGYIYHGPDNEDVPLGLDEVIWDKRPNPADTGPAGRGIGPVQSILSDVDSARYSAEWNRNFFINGAAPGGFVKFDHRLDDAEFDEFRDRWAETHQGVANAHRVGILENAEWVDANFSPRDMQFAQLRDVSRDIMREAYRIHPHMLGQSEDVNLANAQAADYTFAQWSLVPRLDRWRDVLNGPYLKLFGTTGQGVEFDYDNPVPEDQEAANAERASKTTAFKTLIDAGVDPDSAAEVVGLPPMKMKAAVLPNKEVPPDTTVPTNLNARLVPGWVAVGGQLDPVMSNRGAR